MKRLIFCLFIIFLIHTVEGASFAGDTSISGQVIDAETGTPLVDVHVSLLRTAEGAPLFRTGRTGEFRFDEIVQGRYTLRFERVGYETLDQEIVVNADSTAMTVKLKRSPLQLGEVVVTPGDEEHAHFEKTTDLNLSAQELGQQMGAALAETLSGEVGIAQRTMGRAAARPVIRDMGGDRLLILEDGGRTGDKSASAADHAVAIDPTTATNIEITRGPASLIYGSSALGGVVNVKRETIPQTLPNRPTMNLTFQGESVNSGLTGTTGLTIPIGDLAWRLELNRRHTDDTHTPIGVLENTSLSQTNFSTGVSMVKD